MGFRVILFTDDMARHVRDSFIWSLRSLSAPLDGLPEDFDELCPDFDAQEAEEIAREACIPELCQATFYAMTLVAAYRREAVDMTRVQVYWTLLEGLRWKEFEPFIHDWRTVTTGRGTQAPVPERVMPLFPPTTATDDVVLCVRRFCQWSRRGALHPPMPLPGDYWALCPAFDLRRAEKYALAHDLPELTLAAFYAMLMNSARGRGFVSSEAYEGLKEALFDLRWHLVEEWVNESRDFILGRRLLPAVLSEARLNQRDAPGTSEDESN